MNIRNKANVTTASRHLDGVDSSSSLPFLSSDNDDNNSHHLTRIKLKDSRRRITPKSTDKPEASVVFVVKAQPRSLAVCGVRARRDCATTRARASTQMRQQPRCGGARLRVEST